MSFLAVEHIRHLVSTKNDLKNQVRSLQEQLGEPSYDDDVNILLGNTFTMAFYSTTLFSCSPPRMNWLIRFLADDHHITLSKIYLFLPSNTTHPRIQTTMLYSHPTPFLWKKYINPIELAIIKDI